MNPATQRRFIGDFRISNFRCFEELNLSGLGQVNLVVGKNGVGKSTLLEALYIYAEEDKRAALESIASRRGEAWRTLDSAAAILTHFHHEPEVGSEILLGPMDEQLRFRVLQFTKRTGADGFWHFEPSRGLLDIVEREIREGAFPWGLEYSVPGEAVRWFVVGPRHEVLPPLPLLSKTTHSRGLQSVLIEAEGLKADSLAPLWDRIILSDREQEALSLLRTLFPSIQRVSMIGREMGPGSAADRRAFVKSSEFKEPVPIERLGDGVGRILGLSIALVNSQGGVLLIDEFENGLHYSIHDEVWDFVFGACQKLNVQAFLTTHSRDCVEAFARAAAKSEVRGSLIRLERRSGKIRAVQVDEKTLEIAERNEVELR